MPDGDVYIRAIDPHYGTPGPDEATPARWMTAFKSIYNEIITINIPAGIQYGKCVVVNNIGIKKGNIRGNHKFIVKIKTLKLTDEQKNFLKNFKR